MTRGWPAPLPECNFGDTLKDRTVGHCSGHAACYHLPNRVKDDCRMRVLDLEAEAQYGQQRVKEMMAGVKGQPGKRRHVLANVT